VENREQDFYLIDDEPDKRFEIEAVLDLETNRTLERFSMSKGYDGYLYKLRQIVAPGNFAEAWHCFKKENEPFIKTIKVLSK
jgi:hypothetical protein